MGGVGESECWKEGIRGRSTAEGRGGPRLEGAGYREAGRRRGVQRARAEAGHGDARPRTPVSCPPLICDYPWTPGRAGGQCCRIICGTSIFKDNVAQCQESLRSQGTWPPLSSRSYLVY